MNTFNPLQFFSTAFSKENINEQQVKAQEFVQAINSLTQTQIAKAPQRLQESIDSVQQNFSSLQDTIEKSTSQFQNPQAVLEAWGKHFESTYNRNLSLFQKHHEENIQAFGELKGFFEHAGEKIKTETEQNIKQFQEKASEAIVDIQKNIENVHTEIKDNLENVQNQAVRSFNDAVKQTSSFNEKVQEQVTKGVSALSSAVEKTNAAAQAAVKTASSNAKKTK